jgi:hypothetical protein
LAVCFAGVKEISTIGGRTSATVSWTSHSALPQAAARDHRMWPVVTNDYSESCSLGFGTIDPRPRSSTRTRTEEPPKKSSRLYFFSCGFHLVLIKTRPSLRRHELNNVIPRFKVFRWGSPRYNSKLSVELCLARVAGTYANLLEEIKSWCWLVIHEWVASPLQQAAKVYSCTRMRTLKGLVLENLSMASMAARTSPSVAVWVMITSGTKPSSLRSSSC